jgi:hypothetical protein
VARRGSIIAVAAALDTASIPEKARKEQGLGAGTVEGHGQRPPIIGRLQQIFAAQLQPRSRVNNAAMPVPGEA